MSTHRQAPPVERLDLAASTMEATARALVALGKGILAADESLPTIGRRFAARHIPSTEKNRRAYRELLLTTPALDDFISGAILFDETFREKTSTGVPFPEYLIARGIIPGVKVDRGTSPLAGFPGEKITSGLDGLRERLAEYREGGARFTKWRATISIGHQIPTLTGLQANAEMLARFAALSQEAGLVPMVEPEVLSDSDHSLAQCEEVTDLTLKTVFDALFDHRVALEQMLLKVAMVLPGADSAQSIDPRMIAEATLGCLRRNVPAAVPGIVFLSGGQEGEVATERLNAICSADGTPWPWQLSFSFGRALQTSALDLWQGRPNHVTVAQQALHHRAWCNSRALDGTYSPALEDRGDGAAYTNRTSGGQSGTRSPHHEKV